MATEKHTTRTLTELTVDRINPMVDPTDPVETMARVATVLELLRENLEEIPRREPTPPGYPLILHCATVALDLAMEIGRNDGTLPALQLLDHSSE